MPVTWEMLIAEGRLDETGVPLNVTTNYRAPLPNATANYILITITTVLIAKNRCIYVRFHREILARTVLPR